MPTRFTTPVGRVIWGSPTEFHPVTDDNKQPVIDAKTGKQAVEMAFGLAIPKAGERGWHETEWGAELLKAGAEAHPQTYQTPRFSWKLRDGDSTELDDNGKRWCDKPHYPGNWVLTLRQRFPTTLFTSAGDQDPNMEIFAGDYVRAHCDVRGNTGKKPGVYVNPLAIMLIHRGERIASQVSFESTGFGTNNALPPGAKLAEQVPLAATFQPPGAAAVPPVVGTPYTAPAATPPAPVAPPNQAILSVPAAPAVPSGPQMTAKAAGATYESFIGAGWTDAMLREHGYMV